MKNLRKAFPALRQYVYLNNASCGLLSEKVFEYRQDHDLDLLISGSVFRDKQGEILEKVRETVGDFFNCAPNRVGLIHNFSSGFNTLLEGIDKSSKILLLKEDYPSINWAVNSREFDVCYAKIDENLEKNIENALTKNRPDLFCFSIVQYENGIKLETAFLKEMKEKFPDTLFVADGTQFIGTERFDFDASKIDVVIASGYKWMNAGYGNAIMLFQEDVPKKIDPKRFGFNSLQGKYKAHKGNFLGKFEPGHQDTLNFGSVMAAIKFINSVGIDLIEERIKLLSKKAKEEFEKLGLLEEAVVKRTQHSSIFNIGGDDKLLEFLNSKNIISSLKTPGVRVSFHYFNTEEEIDLLVTALKEYHQK
ncbi:aminotransferase class V-fold PLP-dependent enzyme [Gillisia hiemivivida]|uniref:Aminotransferase class V-fold PLP-dependent enzyme n=1 Tax=Gillisia hiemivivida TaxID=291190 RepID=A0A5C6ZVD0_9FLAO|nr:aminotransferase class V-fold PLP-dependent enzyme [Gillisia hiemivivida]TXD94838.1 aminotransferase class V-fold PLP-dependent enzyme [Gillisia hiemivivida]